MVKISKRTTTIILVIVAIVVVWALKNFVLRIDSDPDQLIKARSKGDPKASLKVAEYVDFQCPACAYGAKFLKEYMQKNPDRIFLQLHYYPLGMHKHAMSATIFAECAARQGKFWSFHDMVFEKQDQWSKLADVKPAFYQIADEIGLNKEILDRCVSDPTLEQYVLAERDAGTERGIKSTPTYFINEEMVVGSRTLIEKINKPVIKSSP